jgi:hypothetical protein
MVRLPIINAAGSQPLHDHHGARQQDTTPKGRLHGLLSAIACDPFYPSFCPQILVVEGIGMQLAIPLMGEEAVG